MKPSFETTPRGFAIYNRADTRYHGEIRVQESSTAFIDCCFVYTELAYSNTPTKNPPHLHLTWLDAVKLRDMLSVYIAERDNSDYRKGKAPHADLD